MHNVNLLTLSSSEYPEILRQIPDAPKQLYVMGNLQELLTRPRLSVVGSRRVSVYGRQVTGQLVREAARQGIVIISGLAFGVDAIAHQAALEAGGNTVAVLPCGLDRIYPTSHTALARAILAGGGALVSEYPPKSEPFKTNFIARNRIVSGLSDGVLITEAAAKSGTIHTANFALEQGRTVMSVPGNINSPLSEGTNNLIKSGATPVTELNDILDALGLEQDAQRTLPLSNNPEEAILIELMTNGITNGAELLTLSRLPAQSFNATLTMLEISGRIRPIGAGHWALR